MRPKTSKRDGAEGSTSSATEEAHYAVLVEIMTLKDVLEPCHRLSNRNRKVIKVYFEALTSKEAKTLRGLLEVEELLVK